MPFLSPGENIFFATKNHQKKTKTTTTTTKTAKRTTTTKNEKFSLLFSAFFVFLISSLLFSLSTGKQQQNQQRRRQQTHQPHGHLLDVTKRNANDNDNDSDSENEASTPWQNRKLTHALTTMNRGELRRLAALTADSTMMKAFLEGMLVPRVPGSEGHKRVKDFIVGILEDLGWDVALDSFWSSTPVGEMRFSNVVATLPAESDEGSYLPPRRLTLACHYDSKLMTDARGFEVVFLGATDSAVPCAMMLHLASTMNSVLKKRRKKNLDVTLELIFFDGEEAFHAWTKEDSIYGSRHLASLMSSTPFPRKTSSTSRLDSLDVLVLLDLLGEKQPVFRDFFPETSSLFKELANIEKRMRKDGLLRTRGSRPFFRPTAMAVGGVEDDHLPFLERGVPILHLIPTPFPTAWHKPSDDGTNLHPPTIQDLTEIVAIFVAEYLALEP